jgi:hypothetical protein
MVYVVERYLPGLVPSELERMLDRLDWAAEGLLREGLAVRHLGSTVVPGDEACYCQFEAPSEAAVAEANQRAHAPFDRIVAAVSLLPVCTRQQVDRIRTEGEET